MKKVAAGSFILFLLFSSLAILAPTAAVSAGQSGEKILYAQDFDSGSASEWTLEPGWEITPSEGGYALSGKGHVWATLNAGPWEDYFLRFRVKLEREAALHANIRLSGIKRYFIGINQEQLYLNRQTGESDFSNGLASAGGIGENWHRVTILAVGNGVTVYVDDRLAIQYTDSAPLDSGGVAFESLVNETVWIDDVEVGSGWELTATPTLATPTPILRPSGAAPTLPSGLKWIYTGGPLGGLGYDVRMRLDNPDIMFVTDARSGIFKSSDGGRTWFPSSDGITARSGETGEIIPTFCLTIDPHNPDIVWAGTQFQRGVYKSLDGGTTWKKMDNGISGESLTLRGFTVDPRSSDIVYAAGEISSWEWAGSPQPGKEFDKTRGIIFKTSDGGKNWKTVWKGDNLARYVWIDPRNPDILYASTGIFDREAANSDWKTQTPGGVGVLKSTDGGKTWQQVNQGLGNLYIGTLFMHPQNPDILLAGAGSVTYPQGSGVYITTDGGEHWKQTLDTYSITAVEFSTSDPDIAYAGNYGEVYRSEDGGYTWTRVAGGANGWGAPGVRVGTPIDFQVDPRNPDRIFVDAYGGGNFLSEDGGRTWMDASAGYTGAMVRDIAVDPQAAARVYAAGRSGIFASHSGGEKWTGIATTIRELDWHAVAINPWEPAKLLADITCRGQIFYSEDRGENWMQVLQAPEHMAWRDIEFAPSDPQVVYAGSAGFISCGGFERMAPGTGIFVSYDGGKTWQAANDASTLQAAVTQLAIHPLDAQTVFAATFNQGLLKTSDGGVTWSAVSPETSTFKGRSATAVEFSPANPDVLLAGRFNGGLLMSVDGGKTWKNSSAGLNPEATVVDIVFDPQYPQVVYLVDLFSGVYRSTDGGKTWKAINQGLTMRAVNALAISNDGLHLYAGSEGFGVFRLDLNGVPPEALVEATATLTPTAAPHATRAASSTAPTLAQTPTALLTTAVLAQPSPSTTAQNPTPTPAAAPRRGICSSPLLLAAAAAGWAAWSRARKHKAG